MNSSPPPPSFTLPPLRSNGQYPVTPEESPNGSHDGDQAKDYVSAKRDKGKGKAVVHEDIQAEVRVSMYVRLFEEMITTVLASESYLFTAREIWVLRHILDLPYEPKYLLTRLLLRRKGRIFPFASLLAAYESEISSAGVLDALKLLAKPLPVPRDIVDAEPPAPSDPGPSRPSLRKDKAQASLGVKAKRKPWSGIPSGLSAEEEKADPDLAEALRESLWASRVERIEIDGDGEVIPSPPPSRPSGSRTVSNTSASSAEPDPPDLDERFSLAPGYQPPITAFSRDETTLGLDEIMSCISADELRKIAKARKVPNNMLQRREDVCAALRSVAKKQTTLGFAPVRPAKIKQATLPFGKSTPTSESLLIAQLLPLISMHALQLTPEIHKLVARVNLIFSRTPPLTATASSLMLPSILVTSHRRRYPDYGEPTRSVIWSSRDELLGWERAVHWEAVVGDSLGDSWQEQRKNPQPGFGRKEMVGRVEGAKIVKRIWEGVWPVWLALVEGRGGEAVDVRAETGGLVGDRFKAGHVLTRIVYKAAQALGILHEYDAECMVLKALIQQRRWRRSKRGAWYERLALVLMNHYNETPEQKVEKLREATQICIDGLCDEDTHLSKALDGKADIVYRPALSRRLTRLENKLDLPADERHISYASLHVCETRELLAPRAPDNMGAPKLRSRPSDDAFAEDDEPAWGMQQTGKSVWLGREGEVTVEGWVLEHWEKKGYKGFHSEGSILTTLFALLMWPILFSPLPGAFETSYQTAPLDLGEDTFAPARTELIETLLSEMSSTAKALDMLKTTDDRERPRQTWAVGINWDYDAESLQEVLQCIGGRGMSVICRMLAEEYRHRVSGVPDLLVWQFEERQARFIEVKGPGDSLSETQKVWIDVLLSAGIPVEVCKVKAKEATAAQIEKVKRARKRDSNEWEAVKWEMSEAKAEDMDEEAEENEAPRQAHWERSGKRVKVE